MNATRIARMAAWSVLALGSAQAQNGRCDRSCLEGMISTYLTALAAHDPGRLPATPGVKYAENDQPLPLGKGEWQVAGPAGKYRHVFADPQSGEVAAITTLTEHGVGVIYVVRLKVENGKEILHTVPAGSLPYIRAAYAIKKNEVPTEVGALIEGIAA